MKKPGYRAISIILAFIMIVSLSGNVMAESGGLFVSRAFAAEESEAGAGQDVMQPEAGMNAAAAEEMSESGQTAGAAAVAEEPEQADSDGQEANSEPEAAETAPEGGTSEPEESTPEETIQEETAPEETLPDTEETGTEESVPEPEETVPAEAAPEEAADEAQAEQQMDVKEEDTGAAQPEQEAEDTAENEPADEPAAPAETAVPTPAPTPAPASVPADVPVMRTIPAQAFETTLYDEHGNTTEYIDRVNVFWSWLFERIPFTARDRYPDDYEPVSSEVTVQVTGLLHDGVTARAYFTTMAEEDIYSEKALMALDLELRDAQGNLYTPQGELTITVGGYVVGSAIAQDKALLIYDYRVNAARQNRLREYAADVLVYRDDLVDAGRLRYYGEKGDEEAVLFAEDAEGLTEYEDYTLSFKTTAMPLNLVISEQVRERTMHAQTQDGATDIELSGALSNNTSANITVSYADELSEQTDGGGLVGVDISLEDRETGEYSPDTPIGVTITDASIGEALGRENDLEVWHLGGENGPEKVEGVRFYGNTADFQAEGSLSYVVVETYLEKTLETSDGEVYEVTVSYGRDSGIPANAELYVEEIREGTQAYEEYVEQSVDALGKTRESISFAKAFDIRLVDPRTGEEYQPNEDVDVRIALLDTNLRNEESVDVIHFGDEVEQVECALEDDAVAFKANGFSVYVIIGGSIPLRTYSFYTLDDGGNYVKYFYDTADGVAVYQQTIKGDEKPVVPELPSHEHMTFTGWYVYHPDTDTYDDAPYNFEEAASVTVTEEVILRARFDSYAYLIFHDQYNGSTKTFPIAATRRGVKDTGTGKAVIRISDMSVAYDDSISQDSDDHAETVSKMVFAGWSTVRVENPGDPTGTGPDGTPDVPAEIIEADEVEIEGTVHLYPIFISVYWLDFYTAEAGQGADYFAPIYYTVDESENDFARTSDKHPVSDLLPERPGYTFRGWFTEKEGGTMLVNAAGQVQTANLPCEVRDADDQVIGSFVERDGGLGLEADSTLYAQWDLAPASYTVVIWQQKSSDAPDLEEAARRYDFVESISLTAETGSTVSAKDYTDRTYTGFHFGHCDGDAVVNGNGSTVLNVYYDRDVHVLRFQIQSAGRVDVYTETTGTAGTQYGLLSDGTYVPLTSRQSEHTEYYLSRYNYAGAAEYTQTIYDADSQVVYDPVYPNIYYRSTGARNRLYWLSRTLYTYQWYYTAGGAERLYEGPRYTRTANQSRGWYDIRIIRSLYGARINDYFPIVGTNGVIYNHGERWAPQGPQTQFTEVLVYLDTMPGVNVTFRVNTSTNPTKVMNYYTEVLPGETPAITRSGIGYTLYNSISANYGYITEAEDFTDLAGFVKNGSDPAFNAQGRITTTPANFFYLRKTSTIEFLNSENNNVIEDRTYKFGEDLTALENFVPDEEITPRGKYFTGWYADGGCTTRIYFRAEEDLTEKERSVPHVCYPTMPAGGMQIYAGWGANQYLVQIDPNGGQLTDGESTWFYATYGDPDDGIIKIYEDVTRNFIVTADPGSETPYYYRHHSREYWYRLYGWTGEIPTKRDEPFETPFTVDGVTYYTPREFEATLSDRMANYSPDESVSTDGKVYVFSSGAYRFSGWYEVHEDGSETIYRNDSNDYVDHDTYLRAHWKQVGTYRLVYEPGENGSLDSEDSNSDTFEFLEEESDYIDRSDVVVTRSVTVKEGKLVNFVGWKVRGDESGRIYLPGEALEFPSQYAKHVIREGRDEYVLHLDAQYRELSSVKLIYDANGGTIDESTVDYGSSMDTDPDAPALVRSVDGSRAIVLGMRSNTGYVLSDGTGFSNGYEDPTTHAVTSYELAGWNTAPDGSGSHFDLGAFSEDPEKDLYLDINEGPGGSKPVTLYAEWKVRVYFDKNRDESNWGGDGDYWTQTDSEGNRIYTPVYKDGGTVIERYYRTVTINSTIEEPPYTPRDTHTPTAEDPLRNFAYWSDVRYTDDDSRAVPHDFSEPITGQVTFYGFWRSPIEVPYHVVDASGETLELRDMEPSKWRADPGHFQVTVGTEIPLTAHDETYVNLPESPDYRYAFACISDSVSHITGENRIKALLYDEEQRAAAVRMEDGTIQNLSSGAEIYLVYYEDPLTLDISYTWMDMHGVLADITGSVADTAPRYTIPEISSESVYTMGSQITAPKAWSNNTTYQYYAFAIGKPGAAKDADLNLITEVESSDRTRPSLQLRNSWRGLEYSVDGGASWMSGGYGRELYVVYFKSMPTLINLEELTIGTRMDVLQETFSFDVVITEQRGSGAAAEAEIISENTYTLKSGESRSITVFYTAQTTDSPEIKQMVRIEERPSAQQRAEFKTDRSLDDGGSYTETYVYSHTTSSQSRDHTVIFRNTRRQKDLTLHIAYIDADGIAVDDSLRTMEEEVYKVVVPIYEQRDISGREDSIFTGSSDEYRFAKIVSGIPGEDGRLTNVRELSPGTVHFDRLSESDYYDLYLDGDTEKELANDEYICYVFYRMPRVYYVRETGSGALGILPDPLQSGSPPVTIRQIGTTNEIINGQLLPMSPTGSFLISQLDESGRNWMMANFLNDTVRPNNLRYTRLGVGNVGAASREALQEVSSEDLSMALQVMDDQVKYSYDGETWKGFSGAPAVYAIYHERGCDLHIQKIVEDESRRSTPYKVVIYSPALTEQFYSIAGYGDLSVISANTAEHTITLDEVRHGCDIVISGLQTGSYTVTETVDLDEMDVSMTLDDEELPVTKTNVPDSTEDTAASDSFAINTSTDTSMTVAITNKTGAMEVMFKKTDGYADAAGGAKFSLYRDYACTAVVMLTVGNEKTTEVSSAGTFDGDTGCNVSFKVAPGLYYMKEVGTPPAHTANGPFADSTDIYRVVVGEAGAAKAGITLPDGRGFVIQRMKNAAEIDEEGPDIARYGIMNLYAAQRKAILKKTDTKYTPLEGAVFMIHRADMTLVKDGAQDSFTSVSNGIFRVGMLPLGYYYLHEVVVPEGAADGGSDGWWYTVRVDLEGVTVLSGPDAQPVVPE